MRELADRCISGQGPRHGRKGEGLEQGGERGIGLEEC